VADLSVETLVLKKIDGRVAMERKAYRRSGAWQKFEILGIVASCPLSIRKACLELSIPRSTYQRWKRGYQTRGLEGLKDIPSIPRHRPHRKTDEERQKVLECASIHTHLGSRFLSLTRPSTTF